MSERVISKKRSFVFTDLNLLEYKRALDLQIQTLNSKLDKSLLEDRIIFVEHLPVFTLGKRGGKENLTVSSTPIKFGCKTIAFFKPSQQKKVSIGINGLPP